MAASLGVALLLLLTAGAAAAPTEAMRLQAMEQVAPILGVELPPPEEEKEEENSSADKAAEPGSSSSEPQHIGWAFLPGMQTLSRSLHSHAVRFCSWRILCRSFALSLDRAIEFSPPKL